MVSAILNFPSRFRELVESLESPWISSNNPRIFFNLMHLLAFSLPLLHLLCISSNLLRPPRISSNPHKIPQIFSHLLQLSCIFLHLLWSSRNFSNLLVSLLISSTLLNLTVVSIATYILETYLDIRQHRALLRPTLSPALKGIVSDLRFAKARCYSLDKSRFHFVHAFLMTAVDIGLLLGRALPWAWTVHLWRICMHVYCIWCMSVVSNVCCLYPMYVYWLQRMIFDFNACFLNSMYIFWIRCMFNAHITLPILAQHQEDFNL